MVQNRTRRCVLWVGLWVENPYRGRPACESLNDVLGRGRIARSTNCIECGWLSLERGRILGNPWRKRDSRKSSHGDNDTSTPIETTARKTAKLIPGCRLKVYEGAAHGLPARHAEQLSADLFSFAKSFSSGRKRSNSITRDYYRLVSEDVPGPDLDYCGVSKDKRTGGRRCCRRRDRNCSKHQEK